MFTAPTPGSWAGATIGRDPADHEGTPVKRTMALILAGGEGERLSILSSVRAKPAVPFGGKYRIIDFSLSNCVNSDITDVARPDPVQPALAQRPHRRGPAVGPRPEQGRGQAAPAVHRAAAASPSGTAGPPTRCSATCNVIERSDADTIVILAGDHIYKMDYQPFVAAHRRHRADVTIAVRRVPLADASRMGILAIDDGDRVTEWQEKPKQPKSDLASMGVYVFTQAARCGAGSSDDRVDFGANVIPAMLDGGARVFGYRFSGYWQDVGTIQSYWEANLALCEDRPELDLYDGTGSSTPGRRSAPRPRWARRRRSTAA